MVLRNAMDKIAELLKKYRYAVLILLIGLVLLALPDLNREDATLDVKQTEDPALTPSLEEKLEKILSCVEGAGEVKVILTICAGEEVVYQTDDDKTVTADSSSENCDTVTVTDTNRTQSGLVRQINPAVYQGAIVVCEGAEKPSVHLAIVDAVSKITGLGTNQISVLKMKQ